MSDSDPLLQRLSRAADAATGDDERAATFARGLILGALVGAAIAGSTMWQRRRRPVTPRAADALASDDQTRPAHRGNRG